MIYFFPFTIVPSPPRVPRSAPACPSWWLSSCCSPCCHRLPAGTDTHSSMGTCECNLERFSPPPSPQLCDRPPSPLPRLAPTPPLRLRCPLQAQPPPPQLHPYFGSIQRRRSSSATAGSGDSTGFLTRLMRSNLAPVLAIDGTTATVGIPVLADHWRSLSVLSLCNCVLLVSPSFTHCSPIPAEHSVAAHLSALSIDMRIQVVL